MHAKLPEAAPPEILSADLASLALQLASWREDQAVRHYPSMLCLSLDVLTRARYSSPMLAGWKLHY